MGSASGRVWAALGPETARLAPQQLLTPPAPGVARRVTEVAEVGTRWSVMLAGTPNHGSSLRGGGGGSAETAASSGGRQSSEKASKR